jgi:hypothetical protein
LGTPSSSTSSAQTSPEKFTGTLTRWDSFPTLSHPSDRDLVVQTDPLKRTGTGASGPSAPL